MSKKSHVYVGDFETNSYTDKASVWLFDICKIDDLSHNWGTSIDELINTLLKIKKKKIIVYFHNLKFDGTFIIIWLLKNGYKFVDACDKDMQDADFNCLIDNMKKFYSITLRQKGKIINFRDSLKKIPFSVEQIAKAWNLPISKGTIDYKEIRENHMPTADELDYILKDTEIVARVLNDFYDNDMAKLTLSADCLADFKNIIGAAKFKALFPILDINLDNKIRKSLRGGICFAKIKNQILGGVKCYDVNSMYPSKMKYELLPYGTPKIYKGYKKQFINNMCLYHIRISLSVKDNKMPFYAEPQHNLSFKNKFVENTEGEMIEDYIWCDELELIKQNYDVDIEYIETIMFNACTGIFDEYIDKYYAIKQNEKGAKRQLAKFKLNMLFGRFGLNPYRVKQEPYLEDGVLKFKQNGSVIVDPIYTAMSSSITMRARIFLVKAINENWENFVYCDTDSIFLLDDAVAIEIDSKKLGAWDLEKEFKYLKVLGAKTYTGILTDGSKYTKVCGAPERVKAQINLDNFIYGATFNGKLLPKNVKGGVILKDTEFTIKER